jgi:chromate transporter
MNAFILFLVLLKATVTSFAGLASMPVIRHELVVQRHVLTDENINEAVVITRTTPGPVGLWVVSVGYMAGGIPGAIAGWMAMSAPALLVIALLMFLQKRMEHPRIRSALRAIVIASAGLLLSAVLPLAESAITGPVTVVIALATMFLMVRMKVDTLWIILGAALSTYALSAAGYIAGL